MAPCPAQPFLYAYDHHREFCLGLPVATNSGLDSHSRFWDHQLAARNAPLAVCRFRNLVAGLRRSLPSPLCRAQGQAALDDPSRTPHRPHVDTTTANRHHPMESVIRFVFTLAGVLIIGTPIGIVFLYQSLSLVATQFSHANIKLPQKWDHALSWLIVSPDMHKVHHHHVLPYTDSNYGNIFSIWDRLFGTYMEYDREDIVYGVDTFPDAVENASIRGLLKQPFTNIGNRQVQLLQQIRSNFEV